MSKLLENIIITLLAIAFIRFIIIAIGRENSEALNRADDEELGLLKALHEWAET